MSGESKGAVVAALGANLLIALLKLVAALLAKSSAMLAEAAHSFSDTGNQVLLLVGMRSSNQAPSEAYPFGTARNAYFWSFLVAVLLFGIAGGYSLYEGIEKLRHPAPVEDIRLALAVLAGSFLLEIGSFVVAVRTTIKSARSRGIPGVRVFLDENRDASLLVVLVEDGLALVALPIAGVALWMARATGNPAWDAGASLVIGALLMGFAVFLAWQIQQLILGRGLTKRDLARVEALLRGEPGIVEVWRIQSAYLGPEVVFLGAEVDVDDDLPTAETERLLERLKARLKSDLPVLRYVYLEPRGRRQKTNMEQ